MTKELPYYKFFAAKWISGDITMLSYTAQGVFINICSYYWKKRGSLSWEWLVKRFKDVDIEVFEELKNEDILKVSDDKVIINFLDKQLEEFETEAEGKSERAKKGWNTRRGNQEQSTSSHDDMESISSPDEDDIKSISTSYQLQSIKEKEEDKEEEYINAHASFDEVLKVAKPIAEYFSVSHVDQHQNFKVIVAFVEWLFLNQRVDYFKRQFQAYQKYKAHRDEIRHKWQNYLGKPPDYNGAWNSIDYSKELEKLNNTPDKKPVYVPTTKIHQ